MYFKNSRLLLSGTENYLDALNVMSNMFTRKDYLMSNDFGMAAGNAIYSYLVSKTELMDLDADDKMYLITETPRNVLNAVEYLEEIGEENFFLKELEFKKHERI